MTTGDTFYCDKEEAKDDAFGNKVTIVRCHGRLVTETSPELKAMVKALISNGGRIIVDLSDISHLDSSGTGNTGGSKGVGDQPRLLHTGTREYDAADSGTLAHHQPHTHVCEVNCRSRQRTPWLQLTFRTCGRVWNYF